MNITIPANATTASIKTAHPVPRKATYFRYTEWGRKPIIDKIENLDTLAGCSGKLEYGTVTFEGRGRHAKITGFAALAVASAAIPEVASSHESAPAQTAGRPKGIKLNKIMGFSACAVAKALGKAGLKYDEADCIFKAHGITMPKASLSVQLGFGRNPATWKRHGQPAELTDAQIFSLRKSGVN